MEGKKGEVGRGCSFYTKGIVVFVSQNVILGFPSSMQSMASELNMYESQVAEYKMDIDRLQRELQEVKKKYYLQKKKEHHQK